MAPRFNGDDDGSPAPGEPDPGASPWIPGVDPPSVCCGVCGRLHGPGDPHCQPRTTCVEFERVKLYPSYWTWTRP